MTAQTNTPFQFSELIISPEPPTPYLDRVVQPNLLCDIDEAGVDTSSVLAPVEYRFPEIFRRMFLTVLADTSETGFEVLIQLFGGSSQTQPEAKTILSEVDALLRAQSVEVAIWGDSHVSLLRKAGGADEWIGFVLGGRIDLLNAIELALAT